MKTLVSLVVLAVVSVGSPVGAQVPSTPLPCVTWGVSAVRIYQLEGANEWRRVDEIPITPPAVATKACPTVPGRYCVSVGVVDLKGVEGSRSPVTCFQVAPTFKVGAAVTVNTLAGAITDGPKAVNGPTSWWQVTFATGLSGWYPETSLVLVPVP